MINTMARVTIINQFYTPDISPTAHLSASLAEHLAGDGYEVTVVTSRGGYTRSAQVPDAASESGEDGDRAGSHGSLTVHRIWTPRLGKATILKRCLDYSCFYAGAFWRMVTMPRQDAIISLTTPPYIAWTGALHRMLHAGTKLILWNMDCYPELAERSGKLKDHGFVASIMRRLNRALFRRLDHLVCLDTAMVELLVPQYAPRGRSLPVSVIPNWEEASFFPVDAGHDPWPAANDLGLLDRFVVLYLGNMGYGHRFETIIDAADRLRDEPVTFLFVGSGSHWSTIERDVRHRELDNIILYDYVDKEETPGVMACADCALITLRDRILGVMSPSKLHSNLAMGLPVLYVGPQKSNVDDAIRQFDCGASVRHGDVDGVVAFIRDMMTNPQRMRRLKANARLAFESAYCDTVTLPQFERVIEGVLASSKETAPTTTSPG